MQSDVQAPHEWHISQPQTGQLLVEPRSNGPSLQCQQWKLFAYAICKEQMQTIIVHINTRTIFFIFTRYFSLLLIMDDICHTVCIPLQLFHPVFLCSTACFLTIISSRLLAGCIERQIFIQICAAGVFLRAGFICIESRMLQRQGDMDNAAFLHLFFLRHAASGL